MSFLLAESPRLFSIIFLRQLFLFPSPQSVERDIMTEGLTLNNYNSTRRL